MRWGWLESLEIRVQRGKLKQRTCDEYRRLLHCYVLSRFAAVAIGSITPQAAERFAAELLSGAPHTPTPSPANSKAQLTQGVDHLQIRARRPLSPATFKHAWGVFGRVLRYAVRKSAIAVNPLDNTEIEGGYAVGDEDGFTPHPLTAAQVAAIADHIATQARQPVFGFAVEFLAYTGLRAAEFAGMDVGDVTIGRRRDRSYAGSIAVNRTRRKLGGEWITGTPKSKKSRRTILLDDWLAEKLHHYLTETHPRGEDPNAPLFPNRRNGGAPGPRALDWNAPVAPGALYDNLFKPALAAVGLPVSTPAAAERSADDGSHTPARSAVRGVRLHDLRHTFAVLNLSAGTHYMQVSLWLGHANFSITLNVYGGYVPQDEGGKAHQLAPEPAPAVSATTNPPAGTVVSLTSRRQSAG